MAKSLQDKLGLGLAVQQTQKMQGNEDYSFTTQNPSGSKSIVVSMSEPKTGGPVGGGYVSKTSSVPEAQIASPTVARSSAVTTTTPNVSSGTVIGKPTASGSVSPGSAPSGLKTETIKSYTAPTAEIVPTVPVSPIKPNIADRKPLSLMEFRDKIKMETPNLSNFQATKEARNQFDAQNNVLRTSGVLPSIPNTGISAIDKAQGKLREETLKKIKDTQKSYSLLQADFQENAGYYTNFDAVNRTFNTVLDDVANTLANTKKATLSEQEIQIIADKNGVSAEEVRNPGILYKTRLEPTEEGKQVLGISNRENQIKDMETANERAKIDAKTNLERTTQNLNYQIQDAERQMKENTDWMTASGAWSGTGRSSGYEKGIQNVKDDTGRVIERINEQIGYMNADNAQYLTRLSEDFMNNSTRAKKALDTDVKNLKFNAGIKLNGLEETYGKNSKALLNQLDTIVEKFGMDSLEIQGKYLDNMGKIIANTNANIGLMNTMNTVKSALQNKRYGELTANSGALLQNISLNDVANEVKAGNMDMAKYADTRNLMISTVTSTLQKAGVVVNQDDLNVITSLIDNGATPAQAIARFTGGKVSTGTLARIPGSLGDMRSLGYDANGIPKANGFAWAKNNNPAGLSWNANFENKTPGSLADRLAQKGIQFVRGTERGPGEGGQYVQFASMDDGMEALRTLWEISGEKGQTIGDRLKSFSIAGYTLPVDLAKNFNELSTGEQNELLMLQIQKESPKLYEELKKRGTPTATGGKTYTPTEKAVMDDYLKNPSDPKNIASLKSNKLTSQDINAYKSPPASVGGQVMGSLGIPFDYQSRLWNMIPAQLKNSEGEKATTEQNIKNLYNAGVSAEDASLTLLGFSITDPAQKEVAKKITTQARGIGEKLPDTFYSNVSDYVNRGDMKGAQEYTDRIIEGSLKSALGDEFVSTTNLNFSKATLDRLGTFIEKNKSKIGPISGRFSDLEQKFMNDPDYQALKTLMAGSLADVRRTFGGTAVTATELGALRDFIGLDTKMPIENLISALETNYDTLENKYSTQRGFYGVEKSQGQIEQPPEDKEARKARIRAELQEI